MEPSRSINHEPEATCSTAINCNNASIIQNPSIRYGIRKPQSSAASVPLHSSSSLRGGGGDYNRYVNGNNGGGGGGRSRGRDGGSDRVSIKRQTSDRSSFQSLHYENANDIIMANRKMHTMNLNRPSRTTSRTAMARAGHISSRRGMQHDGSDSYSSKSTASSYGSSCSASSCDGSDTSSSSGEPNLPYPGFPELSMNYLTQEMRPRNWCLLLITNPWFERISILVIIFNCVTLGMYQPCVDDECVSNRCKILQVNIALTHIALNMQTIPTFVARNPVRIPILSFYLHRKLGQCNSTHFSFYFACVSFYFFHSISVIHECFT